MAGTTSRWKADRAEKSRDERWAEKADDPARPQCPVRGRRQHPEAPDQRLRQNCASFN